MCRPPLPGGNRFRTGCIAYYFPIAESAAVGTESFIATLDKAKAVKEQATNINNELKAVIEKYTKK